MLDSGSVMTGTTAPECEGKRARSRFCTPDHVRRREDSAAEVGGELGDGRGTRGKTV